MSEQEDDEQQRFDAVLRQLLHTPPKPRYESKLGWIILVKRLAIPPAAKSHRLLLKHSALYQGGIR